MKLPDKLTEDEDYRYRMVSADRELERKLDGWEVVSLGEDKDGDDEPVRDQNSVLMRKELSDEEKKARDEKKEAQKKARELEKKREEA